MTYGRYIHSTEDENFGIGKDDADVWERERADIKLVAEFIVANWSGDENEVLLAAKRLLGETP